MNKPLADDPAELRALCARLKMEAQSHAMEARGANDTIQKIYQIVSGARGEPGNWNAEVPVREEIERLRGRVAELESGLNTIAQAGTLYGGAWCVAQARGHLESLDFDMWPETGKAPFLPERDLTKMEAGK